MAWRSASSGRRLVLLALGAAFVGLVLVWSLVLAAEVDESSSARNQNAFGHLTALLALAIFTVAVSVMGRLTGLIVGKDNRVSTSKVQVLIWTLVIAGALVSLIAATWVGPDTGFNKIRGADFDVEDYLILLGGPFAAAVLARTMVGSQVANGETAKPPGQPSASQAFSNDDGDADLVDFQYLLFNGVAVVYFLSRFLESPTGGLPDIPSVLFGLTGVSAAGYISNKAIAAGKPTLSSIFPATGPAGHPIEIFGSALLFPKKEGAAIDGGALDTFHPVRVTIGGLEAPVVEGSLTHTKPGEDRLKVTVPTTLTVGEQHDVRVLNFRGMPSDAKQFKVS